MAKKYAKRLLNVRCAVCDRRPHEAGGMLQRHGTRTKAMSRGYERAYICKSCRFRLGLYKEPRTMLWFINKDRKKMGLPPLNANDFGIIKKRFL